jgi:hypothetical protein
MQDELEVEIVSDDLEAAQNACAVAYQILGSLACDFDCFEHPAIQDALTMLSDHRETKELLPWDSRTPEQWRSEAATAAAEYAEKTMCVCGHGSPWHDEDDTRCTVDGCECKAWESREGGAS